MRAGTSQIAEAPLIALREPKVPAYEGGKFPLSTYEALLQGGRHHLGAHRAPASGAGEDRALDDGFL